MSRRAGGATPSSLPPPAADAAARRPRENEVYDVGAIALGEALYANKVLAVLNLG